MSKWHAARLRAAQERIEGLRIQLSVKQRDSETLRNVRGRLGSLYVKALTNQPDRTVTLTAEDLDALTDLVSVEYGIARE